MYQFVHWKSALQKANNPQEVHKVLTEYASGIAPGDKIGLPAACKRVLLEVDMRGGAPVLVREELAFDGDSATANLLHEIAHTFVAAAIRVAHLEAGSRVPPGL